MLLLLRARPCGAKCARNHSQSSQEGTRGLSAADDIMILWSALCSAAAVVGRLHCTSAAAAGVGVDVDDACAELSDPASPYRLHDSVGLKTTFLQIPQINYNRSS